MIELGQIRLQHRTAVYDARNKMRNLANALGYEPIEATRLAIAVSEAARLLRRSDGEARIGISLAMTPPPARLVLEVDIDGASSELARLSGFFDSSSSSTTRGRPGVRATKRLPSPTIDATDAFVAEQRARIQNPSREELMDEIRQKNRELERHSSELEQTVALRTEELKHAMEAAEGASHAKSGFLANMSHELRTPMNAIIGYSEMLMEDAQDEGNQTAVDDLNKIHTAGKHLLSLINDVLDISKIEAGKMDLYLETFEITTLVSGVVSTIETLIQNNGNRLAVEVDPSLTDMHADATKVRQALFNLLSNAAKFTHDGEIHLRVQGEEVGGESWILITVSDTGIGIPPEKLDFVFEEFSQADGSTTRDYGGTGLGLAISRRFCQMMNGDISVTSTLGEGSTFRIRLPAVVTEPPAETPRYANSSSDGELDSSNEPVVLVIDDDPNALELLERTIEAAGARVVTASDGREALSLARTLQPAAITLDIVMPGMDGWEVLSELKADATTADIPVIIVTMTTDRNLGYALGATEFITKPVPRDQLVTLLDRHAIKGEHRHALVVDDKAENREMLRRVLENEGWRVSEAENGRSALALVAEDSPALILLDLMMPVMDGFEFVLEMRRRDPESQIRIVVVTAKDITDEDRRRLNGGVIGLIEREGLDQDALVEMLRERVSNLAPRDG